ncbi:hypothetical protein EXIGLDRAFT_217252 [Exidia glandulosa HHB12029]|uniref:Secreted protein n=1 Tax=Exidia glandulosa HHB12029 TaxID=1314781 RepID=A0A165EF61_EXIGL|nr:hypothetical protein EXIGLDRAFT_217252 [Exidia glandulosa HHB12029]
MARWLLVVLSLCEGLASPFSSPASFHPSVECVTAITRCSDVAPRSRTQLSLAATHHVGTWKIYPWRMVSPAECTHCSVARQCVRLGQCNRQCTAIYSLPRHFASPSQ